MRLSWLLRATKQEPVEMQLQAAVRAVHSQAAPGRAASAGLGEAAERCGDRYTRGVLHCEVCRRVFQYLGFASGIGECQDSLHVVQTLIWSVVCS